MNRKLILAAASLAAVAGPLAAQGRKSSQGIPPGHLPPAGMCRIWIDGVPPGRQPAATDCVTAERNRPANARVIYSSQSGGSIWRRGLNVTRERDALGRVIFRDANGRVITRERTNDGWVIWRDANGNVIRQERIGTRDRDGDHLDKSEKERLKEVRKAEKERLKEARKMDRERLRNDRDLRRGHDDEYDDDNGDRFERRSERGERGERGEGHEKEHGRGKGKPGE